MSTNYEVEERINKMLDFSKNAPLGHIEHLMSFEFLDCDASEQWVNFRLTVPFEASNRIKTAHGGYVAAIGDECLALATHGLLYLREFTTTTLDMQIHTIKAMFPGDEIIIHCDYDHIGKRTILANARFYRDKKLCAIVSENFVLLPKNSVEFLRWEDDK